MPLLYSSLQDFHTWQVPTEALSNITALQLLQQEPGNYAPSQDNKRQRANKNIPLKVSSRTVAYFMPLFSQKKKIPFPAEDGDVLCDVLCVLDN